jgi:hypothetical protein
MSSKLKAKSAAPVSPFLESDGAAQFLCFAPQTLATMRIKGEGPPFSKVGGKILYHIEDLIAWVAECRVRSTAQVAYSGKPRGRPRKTAARDSSQSNIEA